MPEEQQSILFLVVEDDRTVAYFVEGQLAAIREAFPHAVIQLVHTWKDAGRVIFADPAPTVILMDLSMPGSTREETIARVAEIEERSAVIIITGHNEDDVRRMLGESKVEILRKDPRLMSQGFLIRAIVRALSRKQLADEQGRFAKLRTIIQELKNRGFSDAPETTF